MIRRMEVISFQQTSKRSLKKKFVFLFLSHSFIISNVLKHDFIPYKDFIAKYIVNYFPGLAGHGLFVSFGHFLAQRTPGFLPKMAVYHNAQEGL